MRAASPWIRTSTIFALLAGCLLAQDPAVPGVEGPPPPPPPFGPPPNPLLIALDADDDGELSGEEIRKAPEALKALDRNKDGKLSEIELRPPPPPGRLGPGRGFAGFADSVLRFDEDRDGKVTARELPERLRRLIREGDSNSDGSLDRSEIERIARKNARPMPPPGLEPPDGF